VARAAGVVELSVSEEQELRAWLRRPSVTQQQATRARIVLRAAEGVSNTQIAAKTHVSLPTVGLWRRKFCERRLEGLADAPRSGRPRQIDDDEVQRVLAKTLESPPDASTHWSVRRLAAATGGSSDLTRRGSRMLHRN
jgi:transposase